MKIKFNLAFSSIAFTLLYSANNFVFAAYSVSSSSSSSYSVSISSDAANKENKETTECKSSYQDIQDENSMIRQYNNGAAISFHKEHVHYKLSERDEWIYFGQRPELDIFCGCYEAYIHNFPENIGGEKLTPLEYQNSELFIKQSLQQIEKTYPVYFPSCEMGLILDAPIFKTDFEELH